MAGLGSSVTFCSVQCNGFESCSKQKSERRCCGSTQMSSLIMMKFSESLLYVVLSPDTGVDKDFLKKSQRQEIFYTLQGHTALLLQSYRTKAGHGDSQTGERGCVAVKLYQGKRLNFIYIKVNIYVHDCLPCTCGCLWRPDTGIRSCVDLELQVVVSYQKWMPGAELRASGGAGGALNCCTIFPAL